MTLYGISQTIGAGVFTLTGLANQYTGGSVCVAFLLAGFIAIFTGLSFAEFSGRMPFNGSAYSYVYASMGEFPAFIIGWNQSLRYGICGAVLARAWAEYIFGLLTLLGINMPEWTHHIRIDWPMEIDGSPLAVFFICFCYYVICQGTKKSISFATILTFMKLIIVFAIIGLGIPFVNPSNWFPFFTHGFGGVVSAASLVFFGYLGFDCVTTVSEEAKNPKRDIPRAVLCGTAICGAIYFTFALVVVGVHHMKGLHKETAVAEVFEAVGANYVAIFVYFGGFLGLLTAGYGPLLSQT